MKYIITFLIFLFLLIPLAFAESSLFDNPDDSFIMTNSVTGGQTPGSGTTGEATGGGGCLTNWTCSSWSSCVGGIQIRNCTKEKAYCYADLKKKPVESQSCSTETGKRNETEGKNISESETPSSSVKERPFNLSYVLFFVMIILFCAVCVVIFRQRKKIKHSIKKLFKKSDRQNNNSLRGLVNKKVYTNDGDYIGKINEIILENNRIHSIKIELDNNTSKYKIKGIILRYSHVKGVGNVIIVDNKAIETIRNK